MVGTDPGTWVVPSGQFGDRSGAIEIVGRDDELAIPTPRSPLATHLVSP